MWYSIQVSDPPVHLGLGTLDTNRTVRDDYIYFSLYLRVSWNPVVAFGFGFDPTTLITALYVGPVSIYIGRNDFTI